MHLPRASTRDVVPVVHLDLADEITAISTLTTAFPATEDEDKKQVKAMAARYAAAFAASARVRRLESELKVLHSRRCELAAARLQRWRRGVLWRRTILPRQLQRVRLLCSSCVTIQKAWRTMCSSRRPSTQKPYSPMTDCMGSPLWSAVGEDEGSIDFSDKSECSLNDPATTHPTNTTNRRDAAQTTELDNAILDSKSDDQSSPLDSILGRRMGNIKTQKGDAGLQDRSGLPPSTINRPATKESSSRADVKNGQHGGTSSCHDGFKIVSLGVYQSNLASWEPEMCTGKNLGPGGPRAAAFWHGCRVRRALSCRSLQTKIQLRHDLYLLISDVEARHHPSRSNAHRLSAWIDVLYVALARLQQEVLQAFGELMQGKVWSWSGARVPVKWRGWPRDLRRFPRLSLVHRNPSPLPSEPSLLGTTTLQTCSPPTSPFVSEIELGNETMAAWRGMRAALQYEDLMHQDRSSLVAPVPEYILEDSASDDDGVVSSILVESAAELGCPGDDTSGPLIFTERSDQEEVKFTDQSGSVDGERKRVSPAPEPRDNCATGVARTRLHMPSWGFSDGPVKSQGFMDMAAVELSQGALPAARNYDVSDDPSTCQSRGRSPMSNHDPTRMRTAGSPRWARRNRIAANLNSSAASLEQAFSSYNNKLENQFLSVKHNIDCHGKGEVEAIQHR